MHIWSIPSILQFGAPQSIDGRNLRSPVRTLSNHRGQITALVCGHGRHATIAASAATDSSIIIWDYVKGDLLRTYLLESVPRALLLDRLDRGFFAAYEDGSVQRIDFYTLIEYNSTNGLLNGNDAPKAIQPTSSTRWKRPTEEPSDAPGNLALSLALSWDGSQLISGHQDGKITLWDVATGKCQPNFAQLPGPVTNLVMLPITGLRTTATKPFHIQTVVKPRVGGLVGQHADQAVPGTYTVTCVPSKQLPTAPSCAAAISQVPSPPARPDAAANPISDFTQALTHPSLPARQLSDALAELATWGHSSAPPKDTASTEADGEATYLALEPTGVTPEQQNALLKAQIEDLRRTQRASAKVVQRLVEERRWMERDLIRLQRVADGDGRGPVGMEMQGQRVAGSEEGKREEDKSDNGEEDEQMQDQDDEDDVKGDGDRWRSSGSSDKG